MNAQQLALLRMAATLTATGVAFTAEYLVGRTIAARGILANPLNRKRYADHLSALIGRRLVEYTDDPIDGSEPVAITAAGLDALAEVGR